MNFIELCKKAIAIDSSPKYGTKEIADFYASAARDMGFNVEVHEEMRLGIPQSLLIVKLENSNSESDFTMFSQLDTPSPGDFVRWTKTGGNPFSAVVSGDSLHGLGVARGKVDFLVKLFALNKLKDNMFHKMNPVLIGSFGDETGAGALRLIRRKTLKPKLGVVAAPTNMKVATQGPGLAILEVFVPYSDEEKKLKKELEYAENITTESRMFTGKAPKNRAIEHDDTPIGQMLQYLKNLPEGILLLAMSGGERPNQVADSAWLELQLIDSLRDTVISKLVSLHETLHRFTGELRSIRDQEFYPQHSTIHVGSVRTRTDGIHFMCSCRFVPKVSKEQNLQWLNAIEEECKNKGADFQLLEYREPFQANEEAELLKHAHAVMQDLDMPAQNTSTQWCNDANVLQRFGVESLVIGAGGISPVEALSEEKVSITDLEKLQQFYQKLIEEHCS